MPAGCGTDHQRAVRLNLGPDVVHAVKRQGHTDSCEAKAHGDGYAAHQPVPHHRTGKGRHRRHRPRLTPPLLAIRAGLRSIKVGTANRGSRTLQQVHT
jgi:hypothetical protein